MRRRASGVPVKALKVLPHWGSLHLKRLRPSLLPALAMDSLPQWGQQSTASANSLMTTEDSMRDARGASTKEPERRTSTRSSRSPHS